MLETTRRKFVGVTGVTLLVPGCLGTAPSGKSCSDVQENIPDSETAVCPGDDAGVTLRVTESPVARTQDAVTFVLENDSASEITYGPCIWGLYEGREGGWRTRRELSGSAVAATLEPGEEMSYTLQIGGNKPDKACAPYVESLDIGAYLFAVEGDLPDGTNAVFAAPFDVVE